ncbi:MAG: shikimate dehydrogenase family protein [Pseudolabrys sp.]
MQAIHLVTARNCVPAIRLGLIGDNIAESKAADLHRTAGRLCGLDVTYELLVPRDLSLEFDAVFDRARDQGFRGLNITYPYKEKVVRRLRIDDLSVRTIAACNTVLFDAPSPIGANTDYTGFIAAFKNRYGIMAPGIVAIAGTGGVGKAIGFALVQLGAKGLRLFDFDREKAEKLARAIASEHSGIDVQASASIAQAGDGADGLVNATPLGMVGYGGSAFPKTLLNGRRWAFDAVYTPIDTPFMLGARAAGLSIMSGYELYLYQGVDAFKLFTGRQIDPIELRQAIGPKLA